MALLWCFVTVAAAACSRWRAEQEGGGDRLAWLDVCTQLLRGRGGSLRDCFVLYNMLVIGFDSSCCCRSYIWQVRGWSGCCRLGWCWSQHLWASWQTCLGCIPTNCESLYFQLSFRVFSGGTWPLLGISLPSPATMRRGEGVLAGTQAGEHPFVFGLTSASAV